MPASSPSAMRSPWYRGAGLSDRTSNFAAATALATAAGSPPARVIAALSACCCARTVTAWRSLSSSPLFATTVSASGAPSSSASKRPLASSRSPVGTSGSVRTFTSCPTVRAEPTRGAAIAAFAGVSPTVRVEEGAPKRWMPTGNPTTARTMMAVVILKARVRTRVTNSRRRISPTTRRASRPPPGRASAPASGRRTTLTRPTRTDQVPEELGQRRPAPAELVHRSGGQGGGQHRLVVTARDQLQHRTSGLAADSGDVGESRGPAVASGRGVDHQSGRAAGPQLFDRPAGRHLTAVHDADPVAESLDQVELMAGEQHWYDAVALLSKHLAHDVDGQRIEAGERFIQHEDVRVVHQRGGQSVPAAGCPGSASAPRHPVGPRRRAARSRWRRRRPLRGPTSHVAGRGTPAARPPSSVLGHPHPWIEAALLGHVPDPPS